MQVGKKTEQDLDDTYRVDLRYHGGASAADYFSSSMLADKGPLDTQLPYRDRSDALDESAPSCISAMPIPMAWPASWRCAPT
jgi:hypothetical protein